GGRPLGTEDARLAPKRLPFGATLPFLLLDEGLALAEQNHVRPAVGDFPGALFDGGLVAVVVGAFGIAKSSDLRVAKEDNGQATFAEAVEAAQKVDDEWLGNLEASA